MPKARQQTNDGRSEAVRTGLNPGVLRKKSNPVRREAARDTSLGAGQRISPTRSRAAKEAARALD
jgi:hypothetical protein